VTCEERRQTAGHRLGALDVEQVAGAWDSATVTGAAVCVLPAHPRL
jgi:hypothetical protein